MRKRPTDANDLRYRRNCSRIPKYEIFRTEYLTGVAKNQSGRVKEEESEKSRRELTTNRIDSSRSSNLVETFETVVIFLRWRARAKKCEQANSRLAGEGVPDGSTAVGRMARNSRDATGS